MLVLYFLVLFLVGSLAIVAAAWWWGYAHSLALRRAYTILCPETEQPAEVAVNAALAARTLLQGRQELRIAACSRWPEKQGCDQACEAQLPFVADDRTFTRYAPGGLPPEFLRILQPARMTPRLYARIAAARRA